MTTSRPTAVDSLARSWDDVVLGNLPDPGTATTDDGEFLRILHRPDHHLDANPRFVANLQRELVTAWKREPDNARHEFDPVLPVRPGQAGAAAPARFRRWPRPMLPQTSVLASAALLLLTLVSAIAMLASTWQPTFDRESTTESILAPVAHDPATTIGVLASFRVQEAPPMLGRILMERWTYPPHAEPVTTQELTGPLLLYVIKGEIVVALTGGEARLSGEEQSAFSPLSSLRASTGRVSAGQALLLPARTQMTTSNQGENEAVLVAVTAYADTINDWILPFEQAIIKQETLGSAFATFPTGPVEIALQRSNVAAGESIAAPPEGAIQLVGSESKLLAYLRRAPDGSVTNLETEPLRVLIATITPTE